jgi:Tfp pilus assembly protein PilN
MKIKLNLLSVHKKEAIEESKKMRVILKWGMEIFGILLIFFILLLDINYILKTDFSLASYGREKSGLDSKYTEIEKYDSEIKQINSKMTDIENIQKGELYWSKLFFKLNNILTPEITLSNLSNKDFIIFMVGKANTRDALVSLKDRLEKEECFSDVKLPLSNLVSKDNLVFQIEFNVKEECVKNLPQK